MRERPSGADPSPLHRLGALGLPSAADLDDLGFVGGWVPEAEPPVDTAVAPPAAATAQPAADVAQRPTVTSLVADRLPVWLRSSTGPSASATAWLAVACAVCVAVTAYTLLHHRAAATVATGAVFNQPPVAVPVASPSPTGIIVDVGGRVRRPGLVTLPEGARVADALRAAGGALRPRDLLTLNLAARVSDGELLLVGVRPGPPAAPVAGAAGTPDSAAPVDINTATVDQLDALPGVGPVLAQRIVDYRTQHGGFDSVSQLRDVSGIGDATYADLEPLVTV